MTTTGASMPLATAHPPPTDAAQRPDVTPETDGRPPASDPDAPDVTDLPVTLEGRSLGRDAEFTTFVERHQQDLLRTAWLLVGDAHRAEELTQQALVRTYGAWSRARSGDPLAYARRVLVNLRVDAWRRRRREVLVPPEDLPDSASGAPSTADRNADRDQLVRALALLSPRQRRVVVLRHFLGLSEADVALDLGVSVGTVKSTSSRALARLRTALAAPDGTPDPADHTRTTESPR